MDIPITPYTRHAWLDVGQTVRVKLRWYPAPPGAKRFPGYHLFASGDFSDQAPNRAWPGPGEDKRSKRRFIAGIGPMMKYTGAGPICGDPSWYIYGVPKEAIEAAMASPPGPCPGCLAAAPGPPWVRIECPTIMCWPNEACGIAGINVRGGVRVGGGVVAVPSAHAVDARGGVLVSGDAAACRAVRDLLVSGGVLVGGAVRECRRVLDHLVRGGVRVGGGVVAVPSAHAVDARGGVLVSGDATACRAVRDLLVSGGVLVGGAVASEYHDSCGGCDCHTTDYGATLTITVLAGGTLCNGLTGAVVVTTLSGGQYTGPGPGGSMWSIRCQEDGSWLVDVPYTGPILIPCAYDGTHPCQVSSTLPWDVVCTDGVGPPDCCGGAITVRVSSP